MADYFGHVGAGSLSNVSMLDTKRATYAQVQPLCAKIRPRRAPSPCSQFEVSDDADSVQMLTRSSQVGEFYVMGPPLVEPTSKNFMDIIIYNEESDRHVRITWEQAVKATMVGNAALNSAELADWKIKADAWTAANTDLTKYTAAAAEPVYIVITRPFIEHLMHSAVVAVAGRDTGATLFGPAGVSPFPAQTLSHAKGTPRRTV